MKVGDMIMEAGNAVHVFFITQRLRGRVFLRKIRGRCKNG